MSQPRQCRVCGCQDHDACLDPDTGATCSWIAADLCSFCAAEQPYTLLEQMRAIDAQNEMLDVWPPRPLLKLYTDAQATEFLRARR